MTDLELIFSMLGEAATKEIAVNRDAQGFGENKNAARMGGRIARNARLELEEESGTPVISSKNYLGCLIPVSGERELLESDEEVK
jgi:DNA-damage-inducible protein D